MTQLLSETSHDPTGPTISLVPWSITHGHQARHRVTAACEVAASFFIDSACLKPAEKCTSGDHQTEGYCNDHKHPPVVHVFQSCGCRNPAKVISARTSYKIIAVTLLL